MAVFKKSLSTDQWTIQLPSHWLINQLIAWLIFKNCFLIPKRKILAFLRRIPDKLLLPKITPVWLKWTWQFFSPFLLPFNHWPHNSVMSYTITLWLSLLQSNQHESNNIPLGYSNQNLAWYSSSLGWWLRLAARLNNKKIVNNCIFLGCCCWSCVRLLRWD